ncbi:MAG: ROK family protein [Lachnospiraceae bacterium]|nr:ROK family protein [Lachnospiraceae bacterium]
MYRVGIDLGGTNIKAGIVDENQKLIREDSIPTRAERTAEDVIADMAEQVQTLLQKEKLTLKDIEGIGVGCPGTIDAKSGKVLYSNNLAWENVLLCEKLEKNLGTRCKIRVSNDANCAALGEARAGAAKEVKNVILLTLGTGVGGGIIIDGKIFEGANAGGAELGHVSLVMNGELCTCGRKGCVEAYASATALIRDAGRAAAKEPDSLLNALCNGHPERMNGKIPFDAASQGDNTAIRLIERYYDYLAEAIANYVNIFRPDMVLLSGGICNQKERLTEPLNERLRTLCFAGEKSFIPPVRCALLGNRAGIIGAANLLETE